MTVASDSLDLGRYKHAFGGAAIGVVVSLIYRLRHREYFENVMPGVWRRYQKHPMLTKAIIAVTLLVAAGCASSVPLQRSQVDAIARDTSATELDRILGKATVQTELEIVHDEQAYRVRHYHFQMVARQDYMTVCTTTCFLTVTTTPVLSAYVVIQRLPEKTLHAWGTLEELSKDPDDAISSIMPTLKQRLTEEYERQLAERRQQR